jgi:anti-sigma B factor antagonist
MTITERQVGSITVLDLVGKLTSTDDAGRLKDKVASLLFQEQKQIILNLGELSYVDSAGLGEMVSCHSTASRQGGQVKLANLGKRIQDLLVMTRLLTIFDVYDSEEEAVASFGAAK